MSKTAVTFISLDFCCKLSFSSQKRKIFVANSHLSTGRCYCQASDFSCFLSVAVTIPSSHPRRRRLADALAGPRPPRPPPRCAAESATCLAVYREGGAPAVFQSAHCPRWTLLPPGAGEGHGGGGGSFPMGCHVAADRGRRRSQEDRAVCALGIRIPFVGTSSCPRSMN